LPEIISLLHVNNALIAYSRLST